MSTDAQSALRARQGSGARYDSPLAPHDDLLLARRGTAYFLRMLARLPDAGLAEPSLRPGWSRRRLIAEVSCSARSLAIGLKSLREPLCPEEADWQPDAQSAATLPAHALRYFFTHSAKHLDVEWRDLPDGTWERELAVAGQTIPARLSPRLRAAEIWQAALDLDAGGRAADLPAALFTPSNGDVQNGQS
ncbi:maleylpyruvate isomerase N-terminal domain-containing protein [Lutimaribacter marinistellae]|uniref:Maleylpyruvate isomerase N-terminal domain-containing protein n=1 Tax=Lutimaribacter marinistellae TaxID=1820329 RepID=A0ABV7THR1_9RHOB